MDIQTAEQLREKKCRPCEGGVAHLTAEEARSQLERLNGWELSDDVMAIRKKWTVKDFQAAIRFLNRVAEAAEADNHHPDLHLTGYRNVTIELTTHAIGGLSENDFILAAKIDDIPVELRV